MHEKVTTRHSALADLIEKHAKGDGVHATALAGLFVIRATQPSVPLCTLYRPSFCIVAQGQKQVLFAEKLYAYGPEQCLVVSVDLPIVGQVIEATAEEPYLCLMLEIDVALLGDLMLNVDWANSKKSRTAQGLTLTPVEPPLLDATLRLLRLLDEPQDIPVLAPLVIRELLYRLLSSEHSTLLRQIAFNDNRFHAVNRAINWLKHNYSEPFRIETLAREARLSPSALHHHFKAVTAVSPLQYQKQLRLQEARRLMLWQAMDATTAGYSVGYESSSQFSREYSRLFGEPPARDIARLRDGDLLLAI